MMELKEYLGMIAAEVEAELDRQLPEETGDAARLVAAMRYSVFNGGKRLRPALFCAALEVFGLPRDKYMQMAAGLEMIHCYSLIHDDLPAMDNDELRRGKPTCHIAFDEATAILAGDGLLTLGAGMLCRSLPGVDATHQLAAAGVMLRGADVMAKGQAAELAAEEPDVSLLRRIYSGKTAGLFAAAVCGAGHLAAADEAQMKLLADYAEALGLAFQIADDVLDVRGDIKDIGKANGSDARNEKTTYAALLGCDKALDEAKMLAKAAEEAAACLPQKGGMLAAFPGFLVERALRA